MPRFEPQVLVVLCTVPVDGGHAERLARSVVSAKLAACVNVVGPIRSIYEWDGAVADEPELQLLIKTTSERFAALEEHLCREHPYEVPEVVALPVTAGSLPYLTWVAGQSR